MNKLTSQCNKITAHDLNQKTDPMEREEQFSRIIRENGKYIYRICNYYFAESCDRDDAVQEVTARVWQSLPSFRNESKASTWIYRITVNTCLSFIRSEKKRKMVNEQAAGTRDIYEVPGTDDETGSGEQKLVFFKSFVQSLSGIDRSLVSLYLEEVPGKEIAEITGLTEANARVRIHRIKELIKRKWEESQHGT